MANKDIPIIDKQIVVQRLAEGQSTRMAIVGTSIASNQTAARIAKQESHTITQIRSDYLTAINKYAASRDYRAAMLADMVWANKTVRVTLPKPLGEYYRRIDRQDAYFEVPDWDMRLKAIKYIDQIAGIVPMDGSQINVVQQIKN